MNEWHLLSECYSIFSRGRTKFSLIEVSDVIDLLAKTIKKTMKKETWKFIILTIMLAGLAVIAGSACFSASDKENNTHTLKIN